MDLHAADDHGLAPLSIFGARSFWLLVVSLLCGLLRARGIDLTAALGVPDPAGVLDLLMPLVSLLAPLLAWHERLKPARRLVVFGPLK
ncbi:MAG: hypothetical protein U1E59_02110 [Amaricoccus sp.]